MPNKIILYSTGCPKCNVLKTKLKEKGIRYKENNSVTDMVALGISQVPMLSVGTQLFDFKEAVKWVNEQEVNTYEHTFKNE